MKSFLTSEEHLNFKRIEKILELRKESSALILLGSNTLELSKEIEKYFLEKENIIKYIPESTNVLYELTSSKNSDFKLINLYENKDINSIIKNLQFYRDFIPEHNLKLIFIFDYEGLEKLKEEAFDFFSTNSFSFQFTDHSYNYEKKDFEKNSKLKELITKYNAYITLSIKQEPKITLDLLFSIINEASNIQIFEYAIEYSNIALELARKYKHKSEEATLLINLSDILRDKGEIKNSFKKIEKALDIFIKIDYKKGIAKALSQKAINYSVIGKLNLSIKYLNEALEINKKINNKKV